MGPAGNGRWISEKDPGYPFLAAPFQELGVIRWAPLFFGALACLGLVHRRPALARALRRPRSGGPVLLIRRRPGVRLARLHADVHRRLARSRRAPDSCCGRFWQPKHGSGDEPGSASRASWHSSSQPSSATPTRDPRLRRRGRRSSLWRLRAARLPLRMLCWWLALGGTSSAQASPSSTISSTAAR